MQVHKKIRILGEEFCLAVCQSGSGPPNADTIGCVGVRYTDIDTGDEYRCTGEKDGVLSWECCTPLTLDDVMQFLIALGIAPVILDRDGTVLTDDDGYILVNM